MEIVLAARSQHAIRAMAQTRAISRVLRAGFSHVVVLIDSKLETVPAEEIQGHDDGDLGDRHGPTVTAKDVEDAKREAAEDKAKSKAPAAEKETAGATGAKPETSVPRDEVIALREKYRGKKWEEVAIHFGAKKDTKLGELPPKNLGWWINEWSPKAYGGKPIAAVDLELRAALDVAGEETAAAKK
jgi:hypothetical protein